MFNKDYQKALEDLRINARRQANQFNNIIRPVMSTGVVNDGYIYNKMLGDVNGRLITSEIISYLNVITGYNKLNKTIISSHVIPLDDVFTSNGVFNVEEFRCWLIENYEKDIVDSTQRVTGVAVSFLPGEVNRMNADKIRKSPTVIDIKFNVHGRQNNKQRLFPYEWGRTLKNMSQLLWLISIKDNQITNEQFEIGASGTGENAFSWLRVAIESSVGIINVDNPLLYRPIDIKQAYKSSKALQALKKVSPFTYSYEFMGGLSSVRIYKGNRMTMTFNSKKYVNKLLNLIKHEKTPILIQPKDTVIEHLHKKNFPFLALNQSNTANITGARRRKIRIKHDK